PKINSRNLTSTLRSLLQLKRAYRDSITSLRETQLLSPLPEKPSSSLLSQRNPAPLSSPRETQLLSPLPEKPSSSLLSQRNPAPLSSPRETQLLSPLPEKPSSSLLSQRNAAPLSSLRETQLLSPLMELGFSERGERSWVSLGEERGAGFLW